MDLPTSKSFCAATTLAKHQGWLRTVLWARLQNADAVDEVMQEIAVAVIHQQTKPVVIENAGQWLYRVALKQILMYRRKTGRRRRFLQTLSEQTQRAESSAQHYDPLQWLLLREREQSLQTSFGKLRDRDREILLLKYSEGLSYDKIADRLGVTTSSVRMKLHRARQHLKSQLAHDMPSSPQDAPPMPSSKDSIRD
jgi:RNA polymerase sigma-70 factor (ECF subfamily)